MSRGRSPSHTQTTGPTDIEFINRYHDELNSLAENIYRRDPDYIVATSRSGPRLLELLQKTGVLSTTVPVLSEKSLEFTPKDTLQDKNVFLFDDVSITGKTLFDLRTRIDNRYDLSKLDSAVFAIDKDVNEIDDRFSNPQLVLKSSKRYELVKSITQAFSHLNKPYDVDHAIFYSSFSTDNMSGFDSNNNLHNISTVYQDRIGSERYTYIPDNADGSGDLLNDILDFKIEPAEIDKFRIYADWENRQLTTVPIVSFPLNADELDDQNIFSPIMPKAYQRIYDEARRHLYSKFSDQNLYSHDHRLPLYRVVWYLVSYVRGLSQHVQHNEFLPELHSPSDFLSIQDLQILFGPELTAEILRYLENSFDKTIDMISSYQSQEQNRSMNTNKPRVVFDQDQKDIYTGILPYVKDHITDKSRCTDKLSTIFEAIQLEFETESEQMMSRGPNDSVQYRKERQTGLTYTQLTKLLSESGMEIDGKSKKSLSLSTDFLIDTGVMIPMFYKNKETGCFERGYRHGEGALNRKGYNYVINSVVEDLFDYAEPNDDNRISIPIIPFEKIGVLVTDRLHNGHYWGKTTTSAVYDFLQGNKVKQELEVGPEYHRYGKVLLLEESISHNNFNFYDWCENKGIVRKTSNGIARTRNWENKNQDYIDEAKSTISDGELVALQSLARCLYDINKNIDDSPPDYLTALTTCQDKESFVHAIRKEIQLFFTHDRWSIKTSVDRSKSIVDEFEDYDTEDFVDLQIDVSQLGDRIEERLNESADAHEAISDITHKQNLREQLKKSNILSDIEEYYENHENEEYRLNYRQNLKPYLDQIRDSERYTDEAVDEIIRKTNLFGEICVSFSGGYRSLLDIIKKLVNGRKRLNSEFTELYKHINKYNELIDENKYTLYSAIELRDFPKIETDQVNIDCVKRREFDPDDFQSIDEIIILISDLLGQYIDSFEKMEHVYGNYFSKRPWNKTASDLFYESKTIEANWVIWYDIHDSTDPENEARVDTFKDEIEDSLDFASSSLNDGAYKYSDDDEKHIFIREKDHVERYLREILKEATFNDLILRMSVCSVPQGYVTKKQSGKLVSKFAHSRSFQIGNTSKDYDKNDGKHSISISKEVEDEMFGNSLPDPMQRQWCLIDTDETKVELKDSDVEIPVKTYCIESESV